jgi:hypothetical protein
LPTSKADRALRAGLGSLKISSVQNAATRTVDVTLTFGS